LGFDEAQRCVAFARLSASRRGHQESCFPSRGAEIAPRTVAL